MKLEPVNKIQGRIEIPGDKSISHRVALIAALASGVSEISNFSTAIDCGSTLSCLQQLGIPIKRSKEKVWISGDAEMKASHGPLDCGNSGSTMRILSGVLAAEDFTSVLTGDESLRSRPMGRIIKPLSEMGATIRSTDGKAPVEIHGTSSPKPITYELPVASAQVKSAILFAGLKANGITRVIEKVKSRDHTERLFNGFGVNVETDKDLSVTLNGPASLTGGSVTVPGDTSSAAYFVAAAALLPGSDLLIRNVGLNPTRAEYLSVLTSWGFKIRTHGQRDERNEPAGDVSIIGGIERGAASASHTLRGASIPSLIDELPLLAVVGSQIDGGVEIRDAAELRHKESDRLACTAQNLREMGVEVTEHDDGISVAGPVRLRGARLNSFGDHRIAMAFSIAALVADGPTEISGADCVDISFPEFFSLLRSVVSA
jgi:3-phosphoshikimate 1-carboxyvinyltransferase